MSMDIYAREGARVVFVHPDAGWPDDVRRAGHYLEKGMNYTIERTQVMDAFTHVFLKQFPGIPFNSVQFEDVK